MLDIVKATNRVIKCSFYSLFFLVPLILTPWNHELFEFNKMMLVYALTILIVGAWLIKMVLRGRIMFRRTLMDIPLLLFLTSQFTSTLLSIDRQTSFWGYYSRFHGGLLSTIAYLLLYWAFVSHVATIDTSDGGVETSTTPPRWKRRNNTMVKNCLIALLGSATFVSLYGIAEHFGIDARYWVQDVQNRVFSTLGQPNWLAAWLVAVIPLTWALALKPKTKNKKPKTQTKKWKKIKKQSVIANFSSRSFPANLRGLLNQFWANLEGFLHTRRLQPKAGLHQRRTDLWPASLAEKSANTTYYLLFTIYYLGLLFTKSRSGLLGFGVSYLVFWPLAFWLNRHQPKNILKPFLLFTFYLLLITFLVGSPWTTSAKDILTKFSSPSSPPSTTLPAGRQADSLPTSHSPLLISESSDIRKVVWQGAIEIWKHHPFFGTGVETFAYSYYWYRPREHNDLSEWDFLYNKAHNEYLNFAATTGTIGLGSYLLVIGSFLFWSFKTLIQTNPSVNSGQVQRIETNRRKLADSLKFANIRLNSHETTPLNISNSTLIIALLSGYCAILVTNFFGFSVVPVALLFFLYPALAASLTSTPQGVKGKTPLRWKSTYTLGGWQYFSIGLILLFTFYFLLFTFKCWYADFLFAQGEKFNQAGQYDQASQPLQKAITIRPKEPSYHNEFALVLSNLAMTAHEEEESSESARQLAEMAVSESDRALKISPYHLNFWKNRIRILHKLGEINENYLQGALVSLLRAVELAPTDAKVFYNLALLYAQVGQDQTAIKTLEETIRLKPNYADARYALALFYEKEEKIKEAKLQLEYILEKINPQYETAREKLESL